MKSLAHTHTQKDVITHEVRRAGRSSGELRHPRTTPQCLLFSPRGFRVIEVYNSVYTQGVRFHAPVITALTYPTSRNSHSTDTGCKFVYTSAAIERKQRTNGGSRKKRERERTREGKSYVSSVSRRYGYRYARWRRSVEQIKVSARVILPGLLTRWETNLAFYSSEESWRSRLDGKVSHCCHISLCVNMD